jgi:uncharacterized protein (TIGR03118 family)
VRHLTALPASPFWLSDNGSGFSTLYTGAGVQIPLFVTIPASASSSPRTPGTPTGIVGNISPTATDFTVTEKGKSGRAFFIFATLDGTISAWNPVVDGVVPGPSPGTNSSHATIVSDQVVAGATYTGLAIATNKEGTFLYAADGGPNRAVDMFDDKFAFVKSFSDPKIPQEFTPYGIVAQPPRARRALMGYASASGGSVARPGSRCFLILCAIASITKASGWKAKTRKVFVLTMPKVR